MNDAWGVYQDRMSARGLTKRDTVLKREIRTIEHRLPDSLSYQFVTMYDPEYGYNILTDEMKRHASERNVAIINSDNLDEKTIIAMPGEDLIHGSLVEWMGQHWLITNRDANSTVYVRAKMVQCNHLLRWVSQDNLVCEQWCLIEDGTKYLTGEYEDRNFVVTRGDSRIAMTIARNEETVRLNRSNRFLIDDVDSPEPLAYLLTKPLKLGWSYNEHGCFKFVLQEVTRTDDDNLELGIADYYKHFERTGPSVGGDAGDSVQSGRKVWL